MTLACVLAVVSLIQPDAGPRPSPISWSKRIELSGNSEFDQFAIVVLNFIRRADWESTAKRCTQPVWFCAAEEESSSKSDSQFLFDDSVNTDEEAIHSYRYRSLRIDPDCPLSSFQLSQFRYFSSLVEGSGSQAGFLPRFLLKPGRADRPYGFRAAIEADYAANATWRIELERADDSWKIVRLVVDSK